jgi:hypothetical protein
MHRGRQTVIGITVPQPIHELGTPVPQLNGVNAGVESTGFIPNGIMATGNSGQGHQRRTGIGIKDGIQFVLAGQHPAQVGHNTGLVLGRATKCGEHAPLKGVGHGRKQSGGIGRVLHAGKRVRDRPTVLVHDLPTGGNPASGSNWPATGGNWSPRGESNS